MNNAKIGAALLGGYALGRTKKAKLAIGLGAALAGSRIRPGQLGKALDTPFLSTVRKQVRTELADASKAAATSVLTAKAENLADAIHARTEGLQERAHHEGEGEEGRAEERAAEEAEGREDEEPEGEEGSRAEAGRSREGQSEERQSRARKAPARRSTGREKTEHRGSGQESEPRKKKTTAAPSRAQSGTSRSRRQGDG
ncbi:ABC transporter substrate-binding protein [Streptomyces sp. HUAS ZL42]|uniref:ABC transporter substrate-binding protein n=1 Tax=Streptomyces sp. HUAS ZL42 TaxID=3231715 RepID=UPI00345EDE9E